jgi:hypothetical protein
MGAILALPALSMISPFFDENTRALRGVGAFAARILAKRF